MRTIILTFLLFYFSYFLRSQNIQFTYNNFENEVLEYEPKQKNGVTDKNFSFAANAIRQTKKVTKNNTNNFNVIDYINLSQAFSWLQEPKEIITLPLQKAIDSDLKYLCSLIKDKDIAYNIKKNSLEYFEIIEFKCNSFGIEEKFDLNQYVLENNLDKKLVSLIHEIQINDQLLRDFSPEQEKFDKKNQILIDSLYTNYKTYLGESLVGNKFKSTMFLVIQHSNLKMQESFLPVIFKAVENDELQITPLKMLIDRIYFQKYKYQIFGSQSDIDIAPEEIRLKVLEKYNLKNK